MFQKEYLSVINIKIQTHFFPLIIFNKLGNLVTLNALNVIVTNNKKSFSINNLVLNWSF